MANIIVLIFFNERISLKILSEVSLSSALVASSKIIISEFLYKDLAIEILCDCPPDIFKPLSPRLVFFPRGSSLIKLLTLEIDERACTVEKRKKIRGFGNEKNLCNKIERPLSYKNIMSKIKYYQYLQPRWTGQLCFYEFDSRWEKNLLSE